jgi:chaperonin cofactor prefoldin
MTQRTLALIGAVALAALCSSTARAQDSQPTAPTQPSPAAAQPVSSTNTAPASAVQPPAKKVWTNDDLGGLRETSSVSTVGNATPANRKSTPESASSARAKDARSYQTQIARLQAQIPPLDQKINELQSALSGNMVTEERHFGGVRPDDWKDELARYQKQREDIQAKIAVLEDEARHHGAPANQIP